MRGPVVALIGAGGIAGAHAAGWAALGARLRIHSSEHAAELAASVPDAVAAATFEEALAGAEIVDVCTPTDTHAQIVRAALAAGVDVFCEKPLARTAAVAATLVEEAETAGRKLLPGHVVRWFGAYEAMHEAVHAGEIGDVVLQRFTRTGAGPERAWFYDLERSGGIILDQMIHDIDQAIWNAGEVGAVAAQATAGDGPGPLVQSAQLVLTHSAGAISYVAGTWAPPGTTFRTTAEIVGTRGLLQHDSLVQPEVRIDTGAGTASGTSTGLLPPVHGVTPYQRELAEFLAWVRGGPAPRLTAGDGVAALRVAEAALASLSGAAGTPGQPVTLTDGGSHAEVRS